MTTPDTELLFWVEITFKLKASPYTETVRYFGTRHSEYGELWNTSPRIVSGLRNISSLGQSVGETLPRQRTGTVVLDNTRGVAGFQTRITDYLEDEEVIGQLLRIQAMRKPVNAVGVSGNVELEYSGIITRVSIDNSNNTILFDTEQIFINAGYIQQVINSTDYPDAPEQSLGQYLPLVFGLAQVPTYRITADDDPDPVYAYATSTNGTYTVGGVDQYYASNYEGRFVKVASATVTTSVLYGLTLTNKPALNSVVNNTGLTAQKIASGNGAILTNGKVWLINQNTVYATDSDPDGTFELSIWTEDSAGLPGVQIGTASIDFSGITSFDNDHEFPFVFKEPVVIEANTNFFFAYKRVLKPGTSEEASGQDYGGAQAWVIDLAWDTSLSTTVTKYVKKYVLDITDGQYTSELSETWDDSGTQLSRAFELRGVKMTDSPTSTGARFALGQGTVSGQTVPGLQKLSFIVDVNGLNDSTGGALTGISSKPLDSPADAAKYILNFGYDNLDIATFDANSILEDVYPRYLGGASSGRQSSRSILAEICANTACKLVARRNGDLAIWAYGINQNPVLTIREIDCRLIDYEYASLDTIVNLVALSYNKKAIPIPVEVFQAGKSREFASSIYWGNSALGFAEDNQDEIDNWTDDSYNIYGERALADSFTNLTWVADDTTAQFVAKYYLTTRNKPVRTFRIEVPYVKPEYSALELMQIVDFDHPDSPYTEGGTPDSLTKNFLYDGDLAVPTGTAIEAFRNAKRYKMRIVGRRLNYNITSKNMPTLELILLVLDNPKEII